MGKNSREIINSARHLVVNMMERRKLITENFSDRYTNEEFKLFCDSFNEFMTRLGIDSSRFDLSMNYEQQRGSMIIECTRKGLPHSLQ